MHEPITIIECPRDAWQGLPALIPSETKAAYLHALIDAGFNHIDAVSFVSPSAVPQMADSERVLELLRPPSTAEIIGIVVNQKGAERALATGAVNTLGFPYSISPEFLHRNQHQSQEESLHILGSVTTLAENAARNVVAYVSMAFGNPYGDPWSIDAVVDACRQLTGLGIWQISLADTVGVATPSQIAETVQAAIEAGSGAHIGVHLHARRDNAAALIRAAYGAGCRRFDSAIGGLGGCPFAQDELVGNIPTEVLVATLADCGAELPALALDDQLIQNSNRIAAGAN
jgi:hydroxymethylglutaryl-CoA lyase